MFDSIKSKLGFAGSNDQGFEQEPYEEGYDGYDGYGDYGEGYDEFADYGPGYDENAQDGYCDSRASSSTYSASNAAGAGAGGASGADAGAGAGAVSSSGYSSSLGRSSRGSSMPKLVSFEDVRAHTQQAGLSRDPLSSRRAGSSSGLGYRAERTMVDSSLPSSLTPEGAQATAAAATAVHRMRSEGLNSLFESTDSGESVSRASASGAHAQHAHHADTAYRGASTSYGASALSSADSFVSAEGSGAPQGASSASAGSHVRTSASALAGGSSDSASKAQRAGFDPYEAYAGGGASSFSSTRSCTVLKPASYDEVERIAKVLKAGDVMVLALRNTPDPLAKRILDFSFGVSSALDASVECVADKVFAITRGAGLTDAERTTLRNQGVL